MNNIFIWILPKIILCVALIYINIIQFNVFKKLFTDDLPSTVPGLEIDALIVNKQTHLPSWSEFSVGKTNIKKLACYEYNESVLKII